MKDDLIKLPKYSRQFPQRPDKMKSPEIEEGLPFVETRIGRMARYASFFEIDRNVHAEEAYREALVTALLEDDVSMEIVDEIADALIRYSPIEADMFSG